MASPGSPSGFRRSFEAFWTKFRKTIYFRLLLLVLVSLLAVLLLQAPNAVLCLSLILVPLMILLIPLWFGERSVKNHAVNGVLVLLIGTLLYAAVLTPSTLSLPQQNQARDADANGQPAKAALFDGIVTPFQGSDATSFNFTVRMKSGDPGGESFTVWTQVLSIDGYSVSGEFFNMTKGPGSVADQTTGRLYWYNTTLPPQIHLFNFEVFRGGDVANASNFIVGTTGSWGPFSVGFGPHFVFFLYRGIFQFAFLVFGFFLVLLIYWWTRKAREIRGAQPKAPERKRAEGGGEFTCTNCGADVSESDTKCPKCGAVFEEAEGEAAKPIHPD